MPVGEIDNRTPEEIVADLEARRKDHVFMTTKEAQDWNAQREKRPVSKNHWSYKADKIKHVLNMGALWKRFAKVMYADVLTIRDHFKEMQTALCELETENTRLRRMMDPCDRCHVAAGEDCDFRCTRDGLRDR